VTRDLRRVEVEPERLRGWVERFAARHGELSTRPSDNGLEISATDGAYATLTVAWPYDPGPAEGGVDGGIDHLVAAAQRPRTFGLLLVRRGGFAAGVAEDAVLVESKVGTRYVQGKTKAGGWSQRRYARRREAQAHSAFTAAADASANVLLPRLDDLGGLATGGDRVALRAVLADPRLKRLGDLPQGRFLAVPDPRRRVLEDAVRRSRAVVVDVHDPDRD
jgi:Actinobacteria/chloroflexi VLRF1 release factor